MSRYNLNKGNRENSRKQIPVGEFSGKAEHSLEFAKDYKVFDYTLLEAFNLTDTSPYSGSGYAKTTERRKEYCEDTWQDMADIILGKSQTNKKYRDVVWENSLRIKSETSEFKRKYFYDVTGQEFDIDLVLKNVPECWLKRENQRVKPSIQVCVNICMSCDVTSTQMINRGSVITAIIEKLQKDYHVDLSIIYTVKIYGNMHLYKINVNCYPIDIDEIAFLIANPLAMRRMMLALTEHNTKRDSCLGAGYGRCDVVRDIPENMIYFGGSEECSMIQFSSIESSKRVLENYIAKWNQE